MKKFIASMVATNLMLFGSMPLCNMSVAAEQTQDDLFEVQLDGKFGVTGTVKAIPESLAGAPYFTYGVTALIKGGAPGRPFPSCPPCRVSSDHWGNIPGTTYPIVSDSNIEQYQFQVDGFPLYRIIFESKDASYRVTSAKYYYIVPTGTNIVSPIATKLNGSSLEVTFAWSPKASLFVPGAAYTLGCKPTYEPAYPITYTVELINGSNATIDAQTLTVTEGKAIAKAIFEIGAIEGTLANYTVRTNSGTGHVSDGSKDYPLNGKYQWPIGYKPNPGLPCRPETLPCPSEVEKGVIVPNFFFGKTSAGKIVISVLPMNPEGLKFVRLLLTETNVDEKNHTQNVEILGTSNSYTITCDPPFPLLGSSPFVRNIVAEFYDESNKLVATVVKAFPF